MLEDRSPTKPGMTLPVASHIDRLEGLLFEIAGELEDSEKELHMLRGAITELSYISKQANLQLNRFLVENIASLKRDLLQVDREHKLQLRDCKDRVATLQIQQQDIEHQIQDYSDLTSKLQDQVGLMGVRASQ